MTQNPSQQFIQTLFQNQIFQGKLTYFLQSKYAQKQLILADSKNVNLLLNDITEEISDICSNKLNENQNKQINQISQQVLKMYEEIASLKSNIQALNLDKNDLSLSTCQNNKLEFSSILVEPQMISTNQMNEIKSNLKDIKQKFDQWFGTSSLNLNASKKFSNLSSNINQSNSEGKNKIEKIIVSMFNQQKNLLFQQFQDKLRSSEILAEKRIQQLSKTINNVLELLNENNNKKLQDQSFKPSNITVNRAANSLSTNANTHKLTKQSSLQNLRIKNFFSFGQN